jgi:hypothetical protein
MLTRNVREYVRARMRRCCMNVVIMACPWDETALKDGARSGVTESMTTKWTLGPEAELA